MSSKGAEAVTTPPILQHAEQAHRLVAAAHATGLPMPYDIAITEYRIRVQCREWEYAAWQDWLDDATSDDRIVDDARHLTTRGRKGEVAVSLTCVIPLVGVSA